MRTLAFLLLLFVAIPIHRSARAATEPVGSGSADTSQPIASASSSADTGWDLVEEYGPIWGGMLLAFGLASKFVRENDTKHWIAKGRTLALIVAGVGVLGSILESHFGGATSAGIIVTLVGAAKMLLNPKPHAVEPPATSSPGSSLATVSLVLALLIPLTSCSGTGPGPVIGSAVIDCTTNHPDQVAKLVADFAAMLKGGAGWSDIYDDAKTAGSAIGGCALAELVEDYLGGKAAPAQGEGQEARATLERFRANEAGGATFKTPAGNL